MADRKPNPKAQALEAAFHHLHGTNEANSEQCQPASNGADVGSTPCFHAVFAFSLGKDDWEIVGIFTKEDEANEYLASIHTCSAAHLHGAGVIEYLPMATILEILVKDRLGAVASAIEQLSEQLVAVVAEKVKS